MFKQAVCTYRILYTESRTAFSKLYFNYRKAVFPIKKRKLYANNDVIMLVIGSFCYSFRRRYSIIIKLDLDQGPTPIWIWAVKLGYCEQPRALASRLCYYIIIILVHKVAPYAVVIRAAMRAERQFIQTSRHEGMQVRCKVKQDCSVDVK